MQHAEAECARFAYVVSDIDAVAWAFDTSNTRHAACRAAAASRHAAQRSLAAPCPRTPRYASDCTALHGFLPLALCCAPLRPQRTAAAARGSMRSGGLHRRAQAGGAGTCACRRIPSVARVRSAGRSRPSSPRTASMQERTPDRTPTLPACLPAYARAHRPVPCSYTRTELRTHACTTAGLHLFALAGKLLPNLSVSFATPEVPDSMRRPSDGANQWRTTPVRRCSDRVLPPWCRVAGCVRRSLGW